MKKIYQAPVTEEVKVEPQLLQTGSLNKDYEITDQNIIGSREGSSFFDDNDEDY